MNDTSTLPGTLPGTTDEPGVTATPTEQLLDEELLVEEISIDGMCGVY
jgi:mycofactocin precursor